MTTWAGAVGRLRLGWLAGGASSWQLRHLLVAILAAIGVMVPTERVAAESVAVAAGCEGGSDGNDLTGECEANPRRPPPGMPDTSQNCRWEPLPWVEFLDASSLRAEMFADGNRYYSDGIRAMREKPDGTIEYGQVLRRCGDLSNQVRFRPAGGPDPVDIAIARVRRQIPIPTPDISPPPEAGGIVNLGLWLAVAERDPISLRVRLGGVSVIVTATLASTEWDMGDGAVVPCEGGGEPIIDLDVIEEGPCVYTYPAPTPDQGPNQVSVTANWTVAWVASDGRSGTADPISRSFTFDYDVDEIVTVGVGN